MKHTRNAFTDRCGYLFIAPYFIFFLLFVFAPILVNIVLSFTNFNLRTLEFIGFKNYAKIMRDQLFWISLQNTLAYMFVTVFVTLLLGLMLALALNSKKISAVKFFRGVIYLPYVTSMVAMAMVWLWMYDPTRGFFNVVLKAAGLQAQDWLFDERLAMPSVMALGIWKNIGYYMTLFLAGLSAIPGYLYEAARIDGANSFQQFRHITLPMLRPMLFFIVITGVISAFNVFEQVNVMTAGGPMNTTTTIVHQIYIRAFTEFKLGYGAAEAVALLLIVMVFTLLNFRYGNQGQDIDIG